MFHVPEFSLEDNGNRRLKAFIVTPEALIELFKNEKPITLSFSGIPPDAKVVGVYIKQEYRQIVLIVESDSFPMRHRYDMLENASVNVARYQLAEV